MLYEVYIEYDNLEDVIYESNSFTDCYEFIGRVHDDYPNQNLWVRDNTNFGDNSYL